MNRGAPVGHQVDFDERTRRVDVSYLRMKVVAAVTLTLDFQQVRPDKYQGGRGIRRAFSGQINGQFSQKDFSLFDAAVKQIDVTEKVVNKGIGRLMIDFFGRADLLDASFVHQHHSVRHFQGFFLIMGDKDAGDFQLIVKPPEPLAQFFVLFVIFVVRTWSHSLPLCRARFVAAKSFYR